VKLVRYLGWLLKAVGFLLVLGFAIKNTGPVVVRYYLGYEWEAPLALVLLIAFVAGCVAGVAASLGYVLRKRRDARLAAAGGGDAAEEAPVTPPML
jgi:uncharacterized integral membrane protein